MAGGARQKDVSGVPTRRDVLKGGGGVVLAGLAGSSAGATSADAGQSLSVSTGRAPGYRPGGPGPLYWSTYGYENLFNKIIPEDVWRANVDWVADTFRDFGYTMVCTDGWIDHTQRITKHGYILSQADRSEEHTSELQSPC